MFPTGAQLDQAMERIPREAEPRRDTIDYLRVIGRDFGFSTQPQQRAEHGGHRAGRLDKLRCEHRPTAVRRENQLPQRDHRTAQLMFDLVPEVPVRERHVRGRIVTVHHTMVRDYVHVLHREYVGRTGKLGHAHDQRRDVVPVEEPVRVLAESHDQARTCVHHENQNVYVRALSHVRAGHVTPVRDDRREARAKYARQYPDEFGFHLFGFFTHIATCSDIIPVFREKDEVSNNRSKHDWNCRIHHVILGVGGVMVYRKYSIPLAFLALFLLPHSSLFAADGVITFIIGSVRVVSGGVESSAVIGQDVFEGDTVRTGSDGLAIVQLSSAGELKLRQNSEIGIDVSRANAATVEIRRGGLFSRVRRDFAGDFNVRSETVVAGVRGTEFFTAYGRTIDDRPDLWLCVNTGAVEVSIAGTDQSTVVRAGEGINIVAGTRLTDPRRYRWTLDLNWNMDPALGDVVDDTDLDRAYSDLLDQDYD
ncbi:MAG: hypothetical protein EA426_11525 [Spirochaetaceae bacterium]|nr:MAG: hypothetical protein EA426_11525 [Spirochaetaceae bacterium]